MELPLHKWPEINLWHFGFVLYEWVEKFGRFSIYSCMKRVNTLICVMTLQGQEGEKTLLSQNKNKRYPCCVRKSHRHLSRCNLSHNYFFKFNALNHYIPFPGELKCVYVRAAAGLVGRDVAEALSRGSDEGSRKLVVGCFLSTWLCPSSSKPDSTPCCLLCLLLSSRSFPKNASWTWQHKAAVNSLCWHLSSRTVSLPF